METQPGAKHKYPGRDKAYFLFYLKFSYLSTLKRKNYSYDKSQNETAPENPGVFPENLEKLFGYKNAALAPLKYNQWFV